MICQPSPTKRGILCPPTPCDSSPFSKKHKKEVTFVFDTPAKRSADPKVFMQKVINTRPSTHSLSRCQSTGKTTSAPSSSRSLKIPTRIGRKPVAFGTQNAAAEEEAEEVKNLEKWEQKGKESLLSLIFPFFRKITISPIDFYVFNLTSKLQSKILHEDKGPSINLKNINYINIVERSRSGPKAIPERKPTDFFVCVAIFWHQFLFRSGATLF